MSNSSVLLPRLGVNLDHVATLRQQRRHVPYPAPSSAAVLAELGGADQITVHLREDRRHIQDNDLMLLRQTITTRLNLEMAATEAMLRVAFDTKPDMVTLVPERREELTTEGGLDVVTNRDHIKRFVHELKSAEIPVSLFIDPHLEQVQMAAKLDADAIELHTGSFCEAKTRVDEKEQHTRLVHGAKMAVKLKLKCYAGHGIHYSNVQDIASILEIEELNIGHSIVARSVLVGMERAVREMRDLAQRARKDAASAR